MKENADRSSASRKTVKLKDVGELLAHALDIESEAVERYSQLADLMESHNNNEVAGFFLKMSEIEQLHVNQITELMQDQKLGYTTVECYQWLTPGAPESADPADLHYLMTPYHALLLALKNEERARDFYAAVVTGTENDAVRKLAAELAEEEEDHIAMVRIWLDKVPEPAEDWDYDDGPPLIQD